MPPVDGLAPILDPANPSRCCPCSLQDGCICNSGNCALTCRTRAGSATLCGFDAFGDPATPPVKYRKRIVSTDDPFVVCGLSHRDCEAGDCQANEFSCHFQGFIPGIPFEVTFDGSITFTGIFSGSAHYLVAMTYNDQHSGCVCSMGGSTGGSGADGSTLIVPVGIESGVNFSVDFGFPFAVPGCNGCVLTGPPVFVAQGDTWDIVEEFIRDPSGDPPCSSECIMTQAINSTSSTTCNGTCDPSGGVVTSLACDDPETCYGAGATTTIVNSQEKRTDGNGCLNDSIGSGSHSYEGTINQTLQTPDTEQDAIDRAVICTSYDTGVDCTPAAGGTAFITPRTTGFDFGFRECQVRGTINNLIVGHTYEMTIGIYNRVYGTSGPFLPDTEIVLTFTAAHVIETTEWINVPNSSGFETKATTCSVVDTAP